MRGLGRPYPAAHWEAAKWTAVLAMTLNHATWHIGSPWTEWGALVGRLSLPVFSLLVVFRMGEFTRARAERYLGGLLLSGLLAQPVYAQLFYGGYLWHLNAMFTLACGVGLVVLTAEMVVWLAVLVAGALVGYGAASLEGGAWMPIAMWASWLWMRSRPGSGAVPLAGVALAAFFMNGGGWVMPSWLSLAAVLGTVVVFGVAPGFSHWLPRLPRWVFYAYYPFHLVVIWGVERLA